MAWTIYNRGLYLVGNTEIDAQDLRILILAGASIPAGLTDTSSYDLNSVADVLGVSGAVEAAASGYSRFTLAGVTLVEDDTDNRAELTWTAPVWSAVAAGETWRAAVLYVEGGSDAARQVIGLDVFASGLPTNGSDITYTAAGINITRS